MRIMLSPKKDYTKDFLVYLKRKIKEAFWMIVDENKLRKVIDEINNNPIVMKKIYGTVSLKKMLDYCINSIVIVEYPDRWELEINKVDILPKTTIKVIDFVNLINYGALDMKGYPIFSDTFMFVQDKLGRYEKMYMMGLY